MKPKTQSWRAPGDVQVLGVYMSLRPVPFRRCFVRRGRDLCRRRRGRRERPKKRVTRARLTHHRGLRGRGPLESSVCAAGAGVGPLWCAGSTPAPLRGVVAGALAAYRAHVCIMKNCGGIMEVRICRQALGIQRNFSTPCKRRAQNRFLFF